MITKKIVFLVFLYLILLLFLCPGDIRPRQPLLLELYNSLHRYNAEGLNLNPTYSQLLSDVMNFFILVRNLHALQLAREGHTGLALGYLAASEARNPHYYHTYFIRAALYAAQSNLEGALSEYHKLANLVPRSPGLVYNRGLLYQQSGSEELALNDFLQTLELDDNFPGASRKLAEIFFARGDYKQAITYYTRNLENVDEGASRARSEPLSPADLMRGEIFRLRGEAYTRAGDPARAVLDFSQALMLDQCDVTARWARLLTNRELCRWAEALLDLEVLKETTPFAPCYLALEAELYYDQGNREQVRRVLTALEQQAPDYMDNYLWTAGQIAGDAHEYGAEIPEITHDSEFVQHTFFTPVHPLRLLLIGDSMAGGALRIALEEMMTTLPRFKFSFEYKVSSGISNSWYFDWQAKIEEILAAGTYDLIIIILGTNDGQAIREEGTLHLFGTPEWSAIYRRRLELFLATIATQTTKVYWLGMPPMASLNFHKRMVLLNTFYTAASALWQNVDYVSTFHILGGEDESYIPTVNVNGEQKQARFGDNIHFRMEGITPLVSALLEKIAEDFIVLN